VAERSVGSILREAEPLITLVPLDVPLEVRARVEARDIGFISRGDKVRIKFHAFPFQKHGTMEGQVEVISEDAFTDNDQQRIYYEIRVSPGEFTLKKVPEGFRLIPGMTVQAEINVGKRTVASYFTYPLLRGLDESLREP
jgi:HlyD family secretion protein